MDLSYLRGAVREGLSKINPNPKKDEDLDIYSQLLPSDFPKLIEKYGEESVLSYVKVMEGRRMKSG